MNTTLEDQVQWLRYLLRLAMEYSMLPTAVILKGIQQDGTWYLIGGFRQVFRGSYQGLLVALKTLQTRMGWSSSEVQAAQVQYTIIFFFSWLTILDLASILS